MEIMALGERGREYALIEFGDFVIDGRQRVFSEDDDIMVTKIKIRIYPKKIFNVRGRSDNINQITCFHDVIIRPYKEPGWNDQLLDKISDVEYVRRKLEKKIIHTDDPAPYLLIWELGEGVSIYDNTEN